MKKTLLILSVVLLSVTNAFAQIPVIIDSVKTQPANPTATDSVYLHIYGFCSYGCALNGPPTVLNAGFNHSVTACYLVNSLSVITNIHDSVYLFTGPAGLHTVTWQIQQNSDQMNPVCDQQVTNGNTTVNVVATGIDQQVQNPFVISWNAQDHSLIYSLPDKASRTFSVYTMSGQLIAKEQTNGSNGKISLDAEAAGLFIVVLEDENGFLFREKIYCQ